MINQRVIPARLEVLSYSKPNEIAEAIKDMTVRGAPAIGVAAAYGVALAGLRSEAGSRESLLADLDAAGQVLCSARPTAVNLRWAVERMLRFAGMVEGSIPTIQQALVDEAGRMAEEDVQTNLRISRNGASLIEDGDTIIHHCNTGALATVDWGTALGVLRMAFEQGKHIHVLVDETRPRLQGARLTAWELQQMGIPFDIISDNAAGYFLHRGEVQKVIFGADRVAANGDVANKVGSYMLALAAVDNQVPVYSTFPCSTVDLATPTGMDIEVEERPDEEVLQVEVYGVKVTPEGATARNPAFDITPARLISGYITDAGVIQQPFNKNYLLATGSHTEHGGQP